MSAPHDHADLPSEVVESRPDPTTQAALAQRLGELVDRAGVGVIEFGLDGVGKFVNSHWRNLTGIAQPTPIPPDLLTGCLHPDDRDRVRADWTAAVASGLPFEAVTRLLHPDGEIRRVQTRSEPLFDREGRLDGFVATLTDITQTLRSEDLTGRSHYRALHEQAPMGQLVLDLQGAIVDANQAFADIVGVSPSHLVGRDAFELVHPDDAPTVSAHFANLSQGNSSFADEELRLLRSDGSAAWVAVGASLVRGTDGTPRYIQAVTFDVTTRRQAQDALVESEHRHRAVVDALHEGVLILDHHGIVRAANASAERTVGIDGDDRPFDERWSTLAQVTFVDHDGELIPLDALPTMQALRDGRSFSDVVIGVCDDDKPTLWLSLNVRPLELPGHSRGVVVSLRDITGEKEVADALRASEARYRSLVDATPVGLAEADMEGRLTHVNNSYARIVGAAPDDLLGTLPWERIHHDDLETLGIGLEQLLTGEVEAFDAEYRMLQADGQYRWVRGPISVTRDAQGHPTSIHGLVQDVHERREAEERARRLARIVESTSDLVGMLDPESGNLLYLNRAARELFGITHDDLTTTDTLSLYTPAAARQWESDIAVTTEMGRTWVGELDMVRADGEVIHVQQTISTDLDRRGVLRQIFFVGRDVTEQHRRELELAHQATHDPLTDLPNRPLILQLAEHALHRAGQNHDMVAMLFIDLDRFKSVNDRLGHEVGDALLVEVARRIAAAVRPSDTVARLGGDEFVVLCEQVADEHQAVAITQRVAGAIESRRYDIAGNSITMTASIGISLSGVDDAHPEGLLRDADAAMYRAKDRGRARHELFDDEMRRRTTWRLALADELATAIEHNQIAVHYQPIIDLRTGRVDGVEALARWDHPTRGTLSPFEFISLAEETGLIVGLGLSVLSKACDQVRRWEVELGNRAPKVHVNLSARQLAARNLPRLVKGVLDQSLVDPERLCLEITESVLMGDAKSSVAVLSELKEIGCELAIDDFGTGYSSLAYLRRFPVDVLKIDRSFVDGLGPDADDSAIVSVIVGLAKTMGLACVAEGVETAEQLAGLRALGCEQAQGYYFARPHPVPAVNRYLTTTFAVEHAEPEPTRSPSRSLTRRRT